VLSENRHQITFKICANRTCLRQTSVSSIYCL